MFFVLILTNLGSFVKYVLFFFLVRLPLSAAVRVDYFLLKHNFNLLDDIQIYLDLTVMLLTENRCTHKTRGVHSCSFHGIASNAAIRSSKNLTR